MEKKDARDIPVRVPAAGDPGGGVQREVPAPSLTMRRCKFCLRPNRPHEDAHGECMLLTWMGARMTPTLADMHAFLLETLDMAGMVSADEQERMGERDLLVDVTKGEGDG